jgi:HK97 family phage major capsid protein
MSKLSYSDSEAIRHILSCDIAKRIERGPEFWIADSLSDMVKSVPMWCRDGAMFYMSPLLAYDWGGRSVVAPYVQTALEHPRCWGYPMVFVDFMPTFGEGTDLVVFGNLDNYRVVNAADVVMAHPDAISVLRAELAKTL